MKKIGILILFSLLTTFTLNAQKKEKIKGDRNVTVYETPINSFNRIVVSEKFKVSLIEGNEARVTIETDENLHNVIEFRVADSSLTFNTSKRITTFKKMEIKVTYTPTLKQIEATEDGEVNSLTSLNIPDMVLSLSGSSRAFLNIRGEKLRFINSERAKAKLNVSVSSATLELNENSKVEALFTADSLVVDMYQRSDADLEGDTQMLQLEADNNSNFMGRNLTANNCEVTASLNSDVHVQVLENLGISADGNSEIYIYENPKIRIDKFAENAKLHKKELKK